MALDSLQSLFLDELKDEWSERSIELTEGHRLTIFLVYLVQYAATTLARGVRTRRTPFARPPCAVG